ncbi:MAG: cytochrome C oxidase subunit IV family protein [Bryobacteraceae bacterium]
MSEPTAHAHADHGHEAHAHHGPKHPTRTFIITLLCLLTLTVITVAASKVDFGAGNIVIALFIATVKASIVAVIFMHLRWDKPINGVLAMAGFLFLGIMLLFCLLDFDTRKDAIPQNLPVKMAPPPTSAAAPGAMAAPAAAPAEHH